MTTVSVGLFQSELKGFFDAVEDIEFKNNGGCLFFCYVFFLWAQENCPEALESFDIVQYESDWSQAIGHNQRWLEGEEENAMSSYHFTWTYKDRELDSEGVVDYSEYENCVSEHLELTGDSTAIEMFCLSALNECSDWNWSFNRKEAKEKLEKRLGIDLNNVMV